MGIFEALDQLAAAFAPSLYQMGTLLSLTVNMPAEYGGAMPLSSAALAGFIGPWVANLGAICMGLANFMNAL